MRMIRTMVWVCADAEDGSGDDVSDDMNDELLQLRDSVAAA